MKEGCYRGTVSGCRWLLLFLSVSFLSVLHLLYNNPRSPSLTCTMRKSLISILPAIVACCASVALVAPSPTQAAGYFSNGNRSNSEKAEIAIMSGNSQKLVDAVTKKIQADPKNPKHYFTRAMAKAMGGDYAGSNEDLLMGVKLMGKKNINGITPDAVWMRISSNRFLLGDIDGGVDAIQNASNLGNEEAAAWLEAHRRDHAITAREHLELAAKYKDSDLSYASALLSRAIKLQPDYPAAYYERGLARWSAGQKKESFEDMNEAATLGHQDAAIWLKDKR